MKVKKAPWLWFAGVMVIVLLVSGVWATIQFTQHKDKTSEHIATVADKQKAVQYVYQLFDNVYADVGEGDIDEKLEKIISEPFSSVPENIVSQVFFTDVSDGDNDRILAYHSLYTIAIQVKDKQLARDTVMKDVDKYVYVDESRGIARVPLSRLIKEKTPYMISLVKEGGSWKIDGHAMLHELDVATFFYDKEQNEK